MILHYLNKTNITYTWLPGCKMDFPQCNWVGVHSSSFLYTQEKSFYTLHTIPTLYLLPLCCTEQPKPKGICNCHFEKFYIAFQLTLIRLTSRCLARTGGWHQKPPVSILAQEPILAQKSCSPNRWHQFKIIRNFFIILFPCITKKMVKNEDLLNNREKWAKITNFVIFEPFQHVIPQKKHFSHRIQFLTEKVWFVWMKIEKN